MKKLIYLLPILFVACNSSESNESKEKTTDKDTAVTEETIPVEETARALYFKSLVGKYKLKNVSGFMGANTMTEYFVSEDGSWDAAGSSIDEGQRVEYDIDLTEKDINKLNSLFIEVNENLSVSIFLENHLWMEIPFEEKVIYRLNPNKEYIPKPDDLTDTSNLSKDWYYIIAQDNISKELMKSLDILDIAADVMVLKVSASKPEFDLNLFYGNCCDNSNYIFRR